MGKTKKQKAIDKFQAAVAFVKEYSGVKGAIIVDPEGLVIAGSSDENFNMEKYAAYSLEIIGALYAPLKNVIEPQIDCLSVKTTDEWLTIAKCEPLTLVVSAGRHVDELLNIRITKALEMISSNLREKYPVQCQPTEMIKMTNLKSLEAINV